MTAVLSLDPSLTAFGWAYWPRCEPGVQPWNAGCWRVQRERVKGAKTGADARRLAGIARLLCDKIAALKDAHDDLAVVAECPTGGRSASVAKALAQSFAVTVTACEFYGVPLRFVTPYAVKRAVGATSSDKAEVAAGVERLTGWRSAGRNAVVREAETDAVAVALAGLETSARGVG